MLVVARARNPISVSSVAKGAPVRPALYSIVEDIVAVDGDYGKEWRAAWNERYLASPNGAMRKLLLDMGWFWGLAGLALAALLAGLIFSPKVTSHDAAWVIGWSVPWVWAALWAVVTFWYVKRALKKERAMAGGVTGFLSVRAE